MIKKANTVSLFCCLFFLLMYNYPILNKTGFTMKTILKYWQQWNHLEQLIEKRRKTFIEKLQMSSDEVEQNLIREFGNEYPNHSLFVIQKIAADFLSLTDEYDSFSVEVKEQLEDSSLLRLSFSGENDMDIYLKYTFKSNPENGDITVLSKTYRDFQYFIPISNDATGLELSYLFE